MNSGNTVPTIIWAIAVASAIVLPCYALIKLGRERNTRIVTFLVRVRVSSWCTAIAYFICACWLWNISRQFGEIFKGLLGRIPLPALTTFFMTYHSLLCCALIVVGIIIVLKDFLSPVLRKLPNWPFVLALVAVVPIVVVALFQPLTRLYIAIGT